MPHHASEHARAAWLRSSNDINPDHRRLPEIRPSSQRTQNRTMTIDSLGMSFGKSKRARNSKGKPFGYR